jgi:hypothetical protein
MEREDVSEPANMKVLMLWSMSSSEMRNSGGRSAAALDFTGGRGRDVKCDIQTRKMQAYRVG